MASLRWHGKKRTEAGLTVIEILLGGILLLLLTLGGISTHQKIQREKAKLACQEKQWRWLRTMDDFELELRKWEARGALCLISGMNPMIREEGRWSLVEIQASSPVVRPMKFPHLIEVPGNISFAPGHRIVVCDGQEMRVGGIKNMSMGSADRPGTVEVEWDSEETFLFQSGSIAVSYINIGIEKGVGDFAGEGVLFRREAERKKGLARNFQNFEIDVQPKEDEEGIFEVFMEASYGECHIERRYTLQALGEAFDLGQWFLGEKQLFMKAWNNLQTEGTF